MPLGLILGPILFNIFISSPDLRVVRGYSLNLPVTMGAAHTLKEKDLIQSELDTLENGQK